jgi:hypothetical protein
LLKKAQIKYSSDYSLDLILSKKQEEVYSLYFSNLRKKNKGNLNKTTETILLLFDTISCPFLDKSFKKKILKDYFAIYNNTLQEQIITEEKNWFIKWQNLNYKKELNSKKSMEVYT